jgi:hypothetical protein
MTNADDMKDARYMLSGQEKRFKLVKTMIPFIKNNTTRVAPIGYYLSPTTE